MSNQIPSFDINSFDFKKNYVIEASAGTGKTYTIKEIVAKLINNSDKTEATINNILIVTYTEKATNQLREEIRNRLPNENVDNASIFTIHSFCKSILDEYSISSNLPLNTNISTDLDIERFADLYIRREDVISKKEKLEKVYTKTNFDKLKGALINAISKYHLDKAGNEEDSIISLNDENMMVASWFFSESLDKFLEKNKKFKEAYDFFKNPPYQSDEFSALIKGIEDKFGKEAFKTSKITTPARKQLIQYVDQIKFYRDYLKEVSKFFSPTSKYSINILLCEILKDAYSEWNKYKEKYKLISFDDMLKITREALTVNTELLRKIQSKYKYGIIDEFQDTNQKAFDVFKMLFIDSNNHIIVVGDKKQAIYSFQGADIEVYLKACNEIGNKNGEIYRLDTCYRATKSIVDSCNTLFSKFESLNFLPSKALSLQTGKVEHIAMLDGQVLDCGMITTSSVTEPEDFAKFAVQEIVKYCSYNDKNETRLRIGKVTSDDGKFDPKDLRNVSFKDITILYKTRSESSYIEKELKKVGIPYIKYKDDALFKCKECAHWLAILDVISKEELVGSDRKYVKRALFTDFFGYNLEDLNNVIFDKDYIPEIELIYKWREFAKKGNWQDLIYSVIYDSNLMYKLSSLNKVNSLTLYMQLSECCLSYLIKNNDLNGLISYLTKLGKNSESDDEDGSGIVKKNTNFDCVKLMTIHSSKGLTLPVVISVAGWKNKKNGDGCFIYHDKNTKKAKMSFIDSTSVNTEEWKDEWDRLWYVAFTRPQYVMLFPRYDGSRYLKTTQINTNINKFVEDEKGTHCTTIDYNSVIDYKMLKSQVKDILNQNISSIIDEKTKDEQINIVLSNIKDEIHKRSVFRHSYSTMSHNKKMDMAVVDGENEIKDREGRIDDEVDLTGLDPAPVVVDSEYYNDSAPQTFSSSYPRGNIFGDLIHKVFEVIDYTVEELDSHKSIIEKEFRDHGYTFTDELFEETKEMIFRVLNAKIPLISVKNAAKPQYFSIKEIKNSDKLTEVTFNSILDDNSKILNNYLTGNIDLLFKKDGRFYILDWKSDSLNASKNFMSYKTKEDLKIQVDKKYSLQRVFYAISLIKWLKTIDRNLTESQIFDKYFGGVYYVFIRGCEKDSTNGVYCQTWENYDVLEKAFNDIYTKFRRKVN